MYARKLFRFRLRTALLLVLALSAFLAFWTNRANRQRRAVAAVGQFGQVIYYHEFPYAVDFKKIRRNTVVQFVDYDAKPPGPTWLRKIVGDDYFQTVRRIHFSPTDESMAYLTDLPEIDHIIIDAYRLSDHGFRHVAALRKLRGLTLQRGYHLTTDGLAVFASLPKLEIVNISETPINRKCLRYFEQLDNLKQLYVEATYLSDTDLDELRAKLKETSIQVHNVGYQPPVGQRTPSFSFSNDELKRMRARWARKKGRN
jgi:hypothetical protein